MNPETTKTIVVAALGRPFSLGMLYDCRRDLLIPGMTLWDSDALENNIGERPQSYNDFEIVSSESIADKSTALNVEASLKASFLSGLVDVEGSAKYLHDDKSSKNQARVTLKYEATTKFLELSMDQLGRGNVKYPYVFDQGIATHVVTGILYGAKAFFVFDQDVSKDENHQDIEGYLKVMIDKIPSISIGGSGSVKLEDTDVKKVEKFSCKFHGDFLLEKTPTTFLEAVSVYQSLPTLLGENGENGVPMKVWLLPLTNIDSTAAKLVREISAVFVEEAQEVLEDLKEADMRCNDALKASVTQQFPDIVKKLKAFKEMCSEFKIEFQRNLAKTLPSIRGGGEEESALGEILEKRMSSPFSNTKQNEWMDCKEREIYTVLSFTTMMNSAKIITSPNHLFKEVLSAENAVCYVFTSLGFDEPYLTALSNYLKEAPSDDSGDVEKEQWYASKDVGDEMRTKAKLFRDFAEANKENKSTKFLIVALTDEDQQGSTIFLFKDGFTVSENFEPPSNPETVFETNYNSVNLKMSPPRFGAANLTSYSVEYCVNGEDAWKQKLAPKTGEVTVGDLKPNTEYVFRCRAVTPAGVGPADATTRPVKTLPCSPPEHPHAESSLCEISVSWEKPAELGQDVQISGYTVEYTITNQTGETELKWNQVTSQSQTATISMLLPNTDYAVRVLCDCGEAGTSKESVTIVCRTPDTYLLLLQEIMCDLPELDTRCKDASQCTTARNFPQIKKSLEMFEQQCGHYRSKMLVSLQEKVSPTLSKQDKETALMDMLKMRNATCFSERNLRVWMQWKEQEIQFVQSLTDRMKNTEIISSYDEFEEAIKAPYAVSFVFTSLDDVKTLQHAVSPSTDPMKMEHLPLDTSMWVPWFKRMGDVVNQKAELFWDFAEANMKNKNTKFLTVGLPDPKQRGATIYLTENGNTVSRNFMPPSKPEILFVKNTIHSMILNIIPPKFGPNNMSYSLEYYVNEMDQRKQKIETKEVEVILKDLERNREYVFRCRAVTPAGVGPVSNTLTCDTSWLLPPPWHHGGIGMPPTESVEAAEVRKPPDA